VSFEKATGSVRQGCLLKQAIAQKRSTKIDRREIKPGAITMIESVKNGYRGYSNIQNKLGVLIS